MTNGTSFGLVAAVANSAELDKCILVVPATIASAASAAVFSAEQLDEQLWLPSAAHL
jgi:hypothetical protein